jgi:hypothetical protein
MEAGEFLYRTRSACSAQGRQPLILIGAVTFRLAQPGFRDDVYALGLCRANHQLLMRWTPRGASGFECVGEGSLTSEYIVNAPIEQTREIVSKAAANAIKVVIPDEDKT